MKHRSERIRNAFNDLSRDTIVSLDSFYAENVRFEDPLGSIDGLPALKRYYARMYSNVESIRFDFSNEVCEGDQHVVFWTMTVCARGFNGGRPVLLIGNSLIQFDVNDRVCYHRDFFDMGAFVYENVPILGAVIRRIRKNLASH